MPAKSPSEDGWALMKDITLLVVGVGVLLLAIGVGVACLRALQTARYDEWGADLASTLSRDSAIDAEVFNVLDEDRDGVLSADESGLSASSFQHADQDGSGELTLNEFSNTPFEALNDAFELIRGLWTPCLYLHNSHNDDEAQFWLYIYNGKPQKAAEAALWYKHGLFQTMLWQYIPAFASSTLDMCKSLGEGMLVGHIYQQGGGGTPTQANVVLSAFGVSKMVPKVMWEAFWSAKAGNQRCGTSKDKMKRSLEKHILKEGEKGLKKEMLKPLKKELSKKLLEIVVSDLPGVGQVASAIPKAYNILTQDTVHKSVSHTIKLCQQEKFGDTSWWESPSMRGKEWRDLKERTAVLTAAAKWSFLHQSLQFIDGVLGSIGQVWSSLSSLSILSAYGQVCIRWHPQHHLGHSENGCQGRI